MTLKTLKELKEYDLSEGAGRDNSDLQEFIEDLQQAAKEWIGELEKNPKEWSCEDNCPNVCDSLKQWIRNFFDLDEIKKSKTEKLEKYPQGERFIR